MIRVLVIAPEIADLPRLTQTAELTRLGDARGVDVETIIGSLVTPERIQQRLRRDRLDVVLWSGHGADGHLLLPGGREVEPRWLASEVKRAGASTVVLAVCDSAKRRGLEGFADVLPAAGVNLVAMSIAVTDTSAVDYNVAMLHALSNGETVREAHRIGVEAIAGRPDASAPQLFAADSAAASELLHQAEQLKRAINSGDHADTMRIIQQCSSTLHDLTSHYAVLDDRVTVIEARLFPPWQVRAWQAFAALVLVVGAVMFIIDETRVVFFPTAPVGATLTTMALMLAAAFLRMAEITRGRLR